MFWPRSKGSFPYPRALSGQLNVVPSPSKNSLNLLKNSLSRSGGLKITLQTPPLPGTSLGTRERVVSPRSARPRLRSCSRPAEPPRFPPRHRSGWGGGCPPRAHIRPPAPVLSLASRCPKQRMSSLIRPGHRWRRTPRRVSAAAPR